MFLNLLSSLFGAVVPSLDSDPQVQYMWRLKIAGLLTLCCISIPLIVMAGTGHLWGFDGFVTRADFATYVAEARKMREDRLRVDLLALQTARCKAPDGDVRRLYNENISRLQEQYHDLKGYDYALFDCSQL